MSMTGHDILQNADLFRAAYPHWPSAEPETPAMPTPPVPRPTPSGTFSGPAWPEFHDLGLPADDCVICPPGTCPGPSCVGNDQADDAYDLHGAHSHADTLAGNCTHNMEAPAMNERKDSPRRQPPQGRSPRPMQNTASPAHACLCGYPASGRQDLADHIEAASQINDGQHHGQRR